MMNRTILKSGVWVFAAILILFTSCDPSKRMQRYMYLVDNPVSTKKSSSEDPMVSESTGKPEPTPEATATNANINKVIKEAEKYLGTPYKYGGTTKKGMDCSALTGNAYSAIGKPLPRSSAGQSEIGKKISRKNVAPGDLIFFDAKKTGKITHVGMVVNVEGEDVKFIHATTSKGVRYDLLNGNYWSQRFVIAKRPQ